MGQGASGAAVGGGFGALWEALGEDTRAQIGALAQKECDALLTPHGGAPAATPQLPLGISLTLDHSAASTALALVPRLQRKHYELIPKVLDEMSFWRGFFSHVTVIVAQNAAELIPVPGQGDTWKCSLPDESFSAAWAAATAEAKDRLVAITAKDSATLLSPAAGAPPPFPTVPLGTIIGISEAAATAALTLVPGLQRKHYLLVPKQLGEKDFWVNFFTHATVILAVP